MKNAAHKLQKCGGLKSKLCAYLIFFFETFPFFIISIVVVTVFTFSNVACPCQYVYSKTLLYSIYLYTHFIMNMDFLLCAVHSHTPPVLSVEFASFILFQFMMLILACVSLFTYIIAYRCCV